MFRPLPALAATLCFAPALTAAVPADEPAAVVPDRQVLQLLVPLNRTQVDVSKFAADRAVTPAVKDFAEKMVAAHEEFGRNLARAARRADAHGTMSRAERRRAEQPLRDDGVVTEEEAAEVEIDEDYREELREEQAEAAEDIREERIDSPGDAVDEALQDAREELREVQEEVTEEAGELRGAGRRVRDRVREGVNRGAAAVARRAAGPRVDLRREAFARSHRMVKEALGRQTGRQFDMAYMNHQMLSHLHMLAAVQTAAEHAGPEMKTVLTAAEEKIEGHLAAARELAMTVDKLED